MKVMNSLYIWEGKLLPIIKLTLIYSFYCAWKVLYKDILKIDVIRLIITTNKTVGFASDYFFFSS